MNTPLATTSADASTNEDAKQILAEQAEDALMAKLRIPQSYADAIVGVKKLLLNVADVRFGPLSLRFGHTRCTGNRMSGLTRTQADTFQK